VFIATAVGAATRDFLMHRDGGGGDDEDGLRSGRETNQIESKAYDGHTDGDCDNTSKLACQLVSRRFIICLPMMLVVGKQ
jgi:hypothetical protein